jgi:hypothetical protein
LLAFGWASAGSRRERNSAFVKIAQIAVNSPREELIVQGSRKYMIPVRIANSIAKTGSGASAQVSGELKRFPFPTCAGHGIL